MLARKLLPLGAVLALAACGGTASAAGAPKPSPSPRVRNGASGQLVKITGTTLVLSGTNGDITVVYDGSTRISKTSSAGLGDIVPGLCLVATGQKDAAGALTASTVRLSNPVSGSCAPQRSAGAPTPGGFGSFGGNRARPSPPAGFGLAAGTVTAVSGTQITITPIAGGVSSLTVPTTVTVSRTVTATSADLQVGECITAAGRRDASGTVTAVALTIAPPNASGTCSVRGFGGFFGGGGGFFGGGGGGGGG